MNTVWIASKNQGKIKEFIKMFERFDVSVRSLLDVDDAPDVEETGDTFEENARLKAVAISEKYNAVAISDDSGLVIDALDGRPGVYSARYAGEEKSDQKNIEKVLDELQGVPEEKRTARFYCVLAVSIPGRPVRYVKGTCEGVILDQPNGEHGFGYDPIFCIPDLNQTLAQLSSEKKNQISHRAKAMEQLEDIWPEIMEDLK